MKIGLSTFPFTLHQGTKLATEGGVGKDEEFAGVPHQLFPSCQGGGGEVPLHQEGADGGQYE